MKNVKLNSVSVLLFQENNNIRVQTSIDNIILINQDLKSVEKLIKQNFLIVFNYYQSVKKAECEKEDLSIISISIVLHYLYMYNSWRNMYKHYSSLSLEFNEKDFENNSTFDMILNYYKSKYPFDWKEKCFSLFRMTDDQFLHFYTEREFYLNK